MIGLIFTSLLFKFGFALQFLFLLWLVIFLKNCLLFLEALKFKFLLTPTIFLSAVLNFVGTNLSLGDTLSALPDKYLLVKYLLRSITLSVK